MEINAIPTTPAAILAWVAGIAFLLLAAFVRAIMSGRLVPKSMHESIVNALRADRDGWHSKSDVDSETIRTLVDQQADMLAGIREIKDVVSRAAGSRS